MTNKPWWEDKKFVDIGGSYFEPSWAAAALAGDALRGGPAFYDITLEGVGKKPFEDLAKELEDLGGRLMFARPSWRNDPSRSSYYVWDHGLVVIWINDGDLEMRIITNNLEFFETTRKIAEEAIGAKASAGRVYVLISTDKGPKLQSIGVAAVPLERSNYNPEIIEDFDFVVQDLKSTSPSGRLTILDGKPGTGKTFLIRALLDAVPDALFVVVSAHLIPQLADPSMVNALLETRKNKGDLPTVFLVEDADDCLVARDSSNVNAVSALLNLGDGILGAMMDIRIVCTTNAKDDELDEAVRRPGRLNKKIHVGQLRGPVAEDLYAKLTGKKMRFRDGATLAEVYRIARGEGWTPPAKRRSVGFITDTPPSEVQFFESIGVDMEDVVYPDVIDDDE